MRYARTPFCVGILTAVAVLATPTPAQFPGTKEYGPIVIGEAPNMPHLISAHRRQLHFAETGLEGDFAKMGQQDNWNAASDKALGNAFASESVLRERLAAAARSRDDLAAVVGYTLWTHANARAAAALPEEAFKRLENPEKEQAKAQEYAKREVQDAVLRLQAVQVEQNQRIIELLERLVNAPRGAPDERLHRSRGRAR